MTGPFLFVGQNAFNHSDHHEEVRFYHKDGDTFVETKFDPSLLDQGITAPDITIHLEGWYNLSASDFIQY